MQHIVTERFIMNQLHALLLFVLMYMYVQLLSLDEQTLLLYYSYLSDRLEW